MSSRVTHFEIPCNDPEKTMEFFRTVFNWSFRKSGDQNYWFAITGDENEPGINGAVMKKRDPNQPVANSISVADIKKSVKDIKRAGGNIVVPITPIPESGWLCFFKDPDGNIHGVWQDDKGAR